MMGPSTNNKVLYRANYEGLYLFKRVYTRNLRASGSVALLILASPVFKLPLHAASVPGSLHARPQAGLSDGAAAPRGGRPSVQTGRRSQGSQIRQRADGV